MPVSYAGAVAEHTAVRTAVGLFDVSHLGKATRHRAGCGGVRERGPDQRPGPDRPGKAQYTLCCTADGGVVDDLIAYYVADDEIFLMPNAANTATVVAALAAAAPAGMEVVDRHTDFAVLAVQGPASARGAGRGRAADRSRLHGVRRRRLAWRAGAGVPHRVHRRTRVRAGARWADAAAVLGRAAGGGTRRGGRPAGLGARDTLRTEMGYPLHGQELGPQITPVQARVRLGGRLAQAEILRPGRAAHEREKSLGSTRRCGGCWRSTVGCCGRDCRCCSTANRSAMTTSGTFSPTLKVGIALGLIDEVAEFADGDEFEVDVRGRRLRCGW